MAKSPCGESQAALSGPPVVPAWAFYVFKEAMMAHKSGHYVSYLLNNVLTPDAAEAVLDLLLSGDLPDLTSLDEWWATIVRRRRQEVKAALADEFGLLCECCSLAPAVDLHEVLVVRSADMSWHQILIFSRGNCALVCRSCHETGRADTDEFKALFRARREEA